MSGSASGSSLTPDQQQMYALALGMPSAAGLQTPVAPDLGILDPNYLAQRDAVLAQYAQRESGGLNIRNPASSASGYWQITNPTWRGGAALAGISPRQYPTARSAPYNTQLLVAQALYDQYGGRPWAQTVQSAPTAVASNPLF